MHFCSRQNWSYSCAFGVLPVGTLPGRCKLYSRSLYCAVPFSESPSDERGSESSRTPADIEYARPASVGEEEIQLQLALAMSKEEHDETLKKQKSDDIKLQLALEESRKVAVDEVRIEEAWTRARWLND